MPKSISSTLGVLMFFSNKEGLNKKYVPIALISIITVISGLVFNDIDYYFFRTFYYYFQLIGCFLLFNFFLKKLGIKKALKGSLVIAIVLTLWSYFEFIISGDIFIRPFSILNRITYGLNSDSALLGILILNTGIIRGNRVIKILLFTAIVMSFSRINILLLIVIQLISILYSIKSEFFKKSLVVILGAVLLVSLTGLLIVSVNSNGYSAEETTFSAKLLNSVNEVTPQNQVSLQLINENYRGYEAYLAITDVIEKGLGHIIFGNGAGARISIDAFQSKAQNMSFFHNGYATLFFHSGILSILAMLYFQRIIYKNARTIDKYFAIALSVILFFYTSAIMGLIWTSPNPILMMLIVVALSPKLRESNLSIT
ncbi:hypothetical protein N9X81_00125 [Schleiferiaceae bacterium]|nr:hypothetical protein [Schleiferiaceae bacterium]